MVNNVMSEKLSDLDKKAKQGADTVYDTFDNTRQEARDIAEEAVQSGKESYRQAKDSARKLWSQARKAGSEWSTRVSETSHEGVNTIRRFAKDRPIQTAAIALTVGVVIGGLMVAAFRED